MKPDCEQARELAERCAEAIRSSVGLSYVQEQWVKEVILRELNLAKLLEDAAMLDWLEQKSPLALWSGTFSDSDYNISLGRAGAPITTLSTMDEDGIETDKEIGGGDSLRTAIRNAMKEEGK